MDEAAHDDKAAVDAAAVARVASGDAVALHELYERYGRVIYSFAYRLTHDATLAEECVQDVFVTLWRRAADFDPTRAKLTTWLFVVARNRAIELGRQKNRRPELRDDLEPVGSGARSGGPGHHCRRIPEGGRGDGGAARGAARGSPTLLFRRAFALRDRRS